MTNPNASGGEWPIPDIVFVSDYPGPVQAATVSSAKVNSCNEWFRIHMDVPHNPVDDIKGKINTGDLQTAYDLILKFNKETGAHPRACAVLAAALGLMDGMPISAYAPKPGPVPGK